MATDDLRRLVRALQRPDLYPHPVDKFETIETHISIVLLTGPIAYKFKKPLDLGFVDFSTLEKRRYFCHEELRLNRRLAPELYLGVVPVTGTPAAPAWDGPGEPIEYAVKMCQFPDTMRLDRVADRGELTARHIDQLADDVASFHAGIARASSDTLFGSAAHVGHRMLQNFEQIDAHLDDPPCADLLDELNAWTQDALQEHCDEFEVRRRQGWVRECHGDMHLANMVLLENRVVVFDCLEFSEDLRWIDTLSEIAFLLMDLDHRGEQALGHRFLNRYLSAADDYLGLPLLPLYLAYRAMVRAKVAAIGIHQHADDPQQVASLREDFTRYVGLATRYSQPRPAAPVVITHGLSGAGKTRLAEQLVERWGAIAIRSDVERKRLFGLHPLARTDSELEADLYSPVATEKTYQRLLALAYAIADAGYPAIVDATFLKRRQRDSFRQLCRTAGIPCVILEVTAPEAVLRERVRARAARAADASEATLEVLEHQLAALDPLGDDERACAVTVDTKQPPDIDGLIDRLKRYAARHAA